MENEQNEAIITPQQNNEQPAEAAPVENAPEETPTEAEKPKEKRSPEEELKYFEGRAKRLRKELGIKDPEPEKKVINKSDELDWGQKAYLKASGVDPSEFTFFQNTMKDTGKDIDTLLNAKWFQAELKDMRDKKTIMEATPTSRPKQGENTKSKVDYWVERPGLPEDRMLAREVVEARYQREKNRSHS